MIRLLGILAFLAHVPGVAAAVDCRDIVYLGNSYTVCEVDPATEQIRLFLHDEAQEILGQFQDVAKHVTPEFDLSFGMNAGMYHADRSPVGLYIEDGLQKQRLITSEGPGNFGLLPNGVFCMRDDRADVVETFAYQASDPACRYATQSGPMLVIDGALHPRFLENSTSRHIRNGVGTSADGALVVFAISNNVVTFHEFGSLFRDHLNLPQALYLDGKVSRLHAPQLERSDIGFLLGPIVGVLTPRAQ